MDVQKVYGDERDNAALILEFSNVCPFKYRNVFGCLYCPFRSPDFGPIRSHVEIHKERAMAIRNVDRSSFCKIDVTDLRCAICQEDIHDISTLFEHLINTHAKPLKRNFKTGVVPYLCNDGFACADCGLKFDLFPNLNSHMNSHYPHFICSECGKVFTDEIRLKRHVHRPPQGKFVCSKCNEMFPTDQMKRKHMESKHNVYRHKCPYCNEYFKTFVERIAHLNKYHDKNINYPCPICSVVLKSASNRAAHLRRVHVKDKQCTCPVCGDKFAALDYLKSHMIKHSGENHQCQVCNKTYAWKKSLTEHMRIHNNDKRFVCVHCGKAFVQKCSLKGHVNTHHSGFEMKVLEQPCKESGLKNQTS